MMEEYSTTDRAIHPLPIDYQPNKQYRWGGRRVDRPRHWLSQCATRALVVSLFTLLLTWGCRLLIEYVFLLPLADQYWMRDYLGNLCVALLILTLARKPGPTLLLTLILVAGFQIANAAKLSVLGTPISPDDFLHLQNVFYLTHGWQRVGFILIVALPAVVALITFPFKRVGTWLVLLLMTFSTGVIANYSEPLSVYFDSRFGHSVWNQPENFKQRGLVLHIVQEFVRTLAKVDKYPDTQSVANAKRHLSTQRPQRSFHEITGAAREVPEITEPRNVHIIVLESFYDPLTLGKDWVPEDPFPKEFRDLWASTGNSTALSPVFGGYTANAEFELLCGFPVIENAVFFEGWLRRQVPCLPSVLADAGYHSIASHPNVAGFWNRTHAYKLVGFEDYWSEDDFDLTDSVQGLLLDHSLFNQVFSRLQAKTDQRPVFNYILTYHGHLPYPNNANYPDKVSSGKESALLHGYLNQLWYKSRDLMGVLDQLKSNDPNALVVVLGDHLPFLGQNYGVYTEALPLPGNQADFSGDMLEYLHSTPLIIIDGIRGPVPVDQLPIYRLPSVILSLLGINDNHTLLDLAKNPDDTIIRPLAGRHLALRNKQAHTCSDELQSSSICADTALWLSDIRVLISDLFTGKQYALQADMN